MKNRKENLMPNGVPKWIRCYDNRGKTFDRYTVVFTKKRIDGEFMYLGMSVNPFYANGFGQHGFSDFLIDSPKYSHLGKKISFSDLPADCQKLVLSDYMYVWSINE